MYGTLKSPLVNIKVFKVGGEALGEFLNLSLLRKPTNTTIVCLIYIPEISNENQ